MLLFYKTDRRIWWLLAAGGLATMLWLLLTGWLIASSLDTQDLHQLWQGVYSRLGWVGLMWVVGMLVIAGVLKRWFDHWVTPAAQLAEQARVLLQTDVVRELAMPANRETRELAQLFNQLVQQREDLRHQMQVKIRQAAERIELERSRLAALMSELTQSVVVCNVDGKVTLYNQEARQLLRNMAASTGGVGAAEWIGLGRSIHNVIAKDLIEHGLSRLQQQRSQGVNNPRTQFITGLQTGHLLRVMMAPVNVYPDTLTNAQSGSQGGYVLILSDFTLEYEQDSLRKRVLTDTIESVRSTWAQLRNSVDQWEAQGGGSQSPLLNDLLKGLELLKQTTDQANQAVTREWASSWPMENIQANDFLQTVARHIEQTTGLPVSTSGDAPNVWLRIETFSVMQALAYLGLRLRDEIDVRFLQLRWQPDVLAGISAEMDLLWSGQVVSTETVMGWELDPIRTGAHTSQWSVRDVVERHGGALWFERDRASHQAFFRFQWPTVAEPKPQQVPTPLDAREGRPEYYDFDLFEASSHTHDLDDMPLSLLAYTVFDTETTGLDPAGGDRIIQMGATRIVNGKLLKGESFDQLVDPERLIPAASIPIHGISQYMVIGQPTIEQVLPVFHAFAQDTVLVAHNAAFDMSFLQRCAASTNLIWNHPVLDTLLLSAVVHPHQTSHRLEAIAERFNIQVEGRHTALGDALVTAQVFIKLLPLLAEQGIVTLKQALDASQKTYYSRLKY